MPNSRAKKNLMRPRKYLKHGGKSKARKGAAMKGYASGGVARGGGAATRGMKFTRSA